MDAITLHEVAVLRLVAQRLADPGFTSAAEAVRWLTAVQAQDYHGALTSVALRTTDRSRAGVEAALDAGEVVRSWPMRGTLHFVAAEDLRWMLELMTPRVLSAAASRRRQLSLDAGALERARHIAGEALAGGRRLSRAELFSVWDADGLSTAGQRGYHMLWHLAQTGLLCFGPVRDREQLVVLVEEWITDSRHPGRNQALGELAWRYFASHGPASLKDFMRWTKLVAADARSGLALAKPRLARVEVEGGEHFMHPETPELLEACRAAAAGVFLLPGFDEFILGYEDRTAVVAAEFASLLVPGANGMFRPVVVIDGRVVGTWRHVGSGARRRLEVVPFAPLADEVTDAVAEVYATLP
ncbi:MAG: winged helix DNA-binding domain-containing protein [Actinomycetota bacterium]|nr:winged helix DNA-binding domain-containing protein [Actinomycetota bacterium]